MGISLLPGAKNALNIAIKRASEPILEKASKRLPKGRQGDIWIELEELYPKKPISAKMMLLRFWGVKKMLPPPAKFKVIGL